MAIDQSDVIDFVTIDQAGNAVLTVSDHLEWDEKNEHIFALQQKLNRYLAFIESGELVERYPETRGKPAVISVVALHQPNGAAQSFLQKVEQVLQGAGIGFRFQQKHFNSP